MDIKKKLHTAKWFALACVALPSYIWNINLSVYFSKEVRDLKKLIKSYQDEYAKACWLEGTKNNQRLRVRHETYDRVLSMGLMHDFIIEDRGFWLGTIRIIVEGKRETGSPKVTYTKSYLVQNMGDQFRDCESVADAIQKLDSLRNS